MESDGSQILELPGISRSVREGIDQGEVRYRFCDRAVVIKYQRSKIRWIGDLQELASLRAAHGIVAVLQFGIGCNPVAHPLHLLVHICDVGHVTILE